MDLVEDFVNTPLEGLLYRQQLLKIAEHFDLEVGDKHLKKNMKSIIKENLLVLHHATTSCCSCFGFCWENS